MQFFISLEDANTVPQTVLLVNLGLLQKVCPVSPPDNFLLRAITQVLSLQPAKPQQHKHMCCYQSTVSFVKRADQLVHASFFCQHLAVQITPPLL